MLTDVFARLCRWSPRARQRSLHRWYQYLAKRHRRHDWRFMNLGYVPLDSRLEPLKLAPEDEAERICAQLYHHVAATVDLSGLDVLEVGSGRGGGSYFIHRYLGPRTTIGVDLAPAAIDLCHRIYDREGLSFQIGDAGALPFEDESFDAVLNVESSHCYVSMDDFLTETRRVLKPGGHVLLADLRYADQLDELHRQLGRSGLELVHEEDITANVIRALELDAERRADLIAASIRGVMLNTFQEFAGVEGSRIHGKFKTGIMVYRSLVLRKAEKPRR